MTHTTSKRPFLFDLRTLSPSPARSPATDQFEASRAGKVLREDRRHPHGLVGFLWKAMGVSLHGETSDFHGTVHWAAVARCEFSDDNATGPAPFRHAEFARSTKCWRLIDRCFYQAGCSFPTSQISDGS